MQRIVFVSISLKLYVYVYTLVLITCAVRGQERNKRKKAVIFKVVDFPAAVEIINIVQWNEK